MGRDGESMAGVRTFDVGYLILRVHRSDTRLFVVPAFGAFGDGNELASVLKVIGGCRYEIRRNT